MYSHAIAVQRDTDTDTLQCFEPFELVFFFLPLPFFFSFLSNIILSSPPTRPRPQFFFFKKYLKKRLRAEIKDLEATVDRDLPFCVLSAVAAP